MSQENVEIVRRSIDAFVADDDAAFRDTLHPEIEWRPFEDRHSPSYGHEGAIRLMRQWLDTWSEHRFDVEDVIGGGDDVLATVRITGRGKASGIEVDVRLYLHFRLRDGKIAYLYEYEDKSEALEAAGLSE
jgi:ketosteroid isomerase-like protein